MVGNRLLAVGLHLLHQVVKEEIYQNGVDFHLGVISFDFPLDQLDTPYATSYTARQSNASPSLQAKPGIGTQLTSQLHFPRTSARNDLLLFYSRT